MTDVVNAVVDRGQETSLPVRIIRRRVAASRLLFRRYRDFLTKIVVGVATAEFLMSFVLVWTALASSWRIAATTTFEAVFGLIMMVVAGLMLGFSYFLLSYAVAKMLSLLFVHLLRSLELTIESVLTGISIGGTSGLLLTLFLGPWSGENSLGDLILMFAATLLGQLGGAIGARKSIRARQNPGAIRTVDSPRWRYRTRKLLLLTAWLAVALTLLRMLGMHTPAWGVYLGCWFGLQVLAVIVCAAVLQIQRRKAVEAGSK